jgi:tripartite-type tricarboxylate transporter receptor subunit TctC
MKPTLYAIGFLLAGAFSPVVEAQQPLSNRPIRLIVPFGTGGATDTFSRVIAQQMTDTMGQPVVVENRTGAGSTIGAEVVAKAAADGHTLLVTDMSTHSIITSLYKKLSFDPVGDFTGVASIATSPLLIVSHPSHNIPSIAQLVQRAKAESGKLTYGSSGNGTITHLAFESMKKRAGIDFVHVPFKGGASTVATILSGELTVSIATIPAFISHVKAGKLVPLAVTSGKRSPHLPDIPAVSETVPGVDAVVWTGVLAPAKTPPDVIERLNAEFTRALDGAKVKEAFAANAADALRMTPAQFQTKFGSEVRAWADVVASSGARID